jgi:hypothetical protein
MLARVSMLRHVSHPCPHIWTPVTHHRSVSAWTWSATLLQSSTAAYTFGMYGSQHVLERYTLIVPRCQRPLVSLFMSLQALTDQNS